MPSAEPAMIAPGDEETLLDGLRQKRSQRVSRLNIAGGVVAGALMLFLACCIGRAVNESWNRAIPLPEMSMFVAAIVYLVALAGGREAFCCYELSRMLKLADTVKARHGSLFDAETQFQLAVEKQRLGWTGFCLSGVVLILGMATPFTLALAERLRPALDLGARVTMFALALGLGTAVLGMALMVACAFRGLRRLPGREGGAR